MPLASPSTEAPWSDSEPKPSTPLEVPWHREAACYRLWYEKDDDLFFADNKQEAAKRNDQAKIWCFTPCPVRAICLRESLVHRDRYGVWGGLNPTERRRLLEEIDAGRTTIEEAVEVICGERAPDERGT